MSTSTRPFQGAAEPVNRTQLDTLSPTLIQVPRARPHPPFPAETVRVIDKPLQTKGKPASTSRKKRGKIGVNFGFLAIFTAKSGRFCQKYSKKNYPEKTSNPLVGPWSIRAAALAWAPRQRPVARVSSWRRAPQSPEERRHSPRWLDRWDPVHRASTLPGA